LFEFHLHVTDSYSHRWLFAILGQRYALKSIDPPGHGISATDALELGWEKIVLAANRNGGMLRLIVSCHDDDDDG